MSNALFEDFNEISSKQWKQKIQYDLKGADYNEKLISVSSEGITVKPFYHPDENIPTHSILPVAPWKICEQIYVHSVEISNKRARSVLNKGAESLWFIIPSEEISPEKLLDGINLKEIPVYIKPEFLSSEYIQKIDRFLVGKVHQVHLQIDILGNLARSGNWFQNLKLDHTELETILQKTTLKNIISIDSALFENSGASIIQQLAYSLGQVNEYFNRFGKLLQGQSVQFVVATGPDYFFEIAKLRALRILFASLASEYNLSEECIIISSPGKRDKTLYDYNINLLRTTTQSMSAVLGGANVVYNSPYDAIYHKNNEFGDRIARNQLLVLKNESYFDKVYNAAEGTYYIESLTQEFAKEALKLFKDLEKNGGFVSQLIEGTIQRKIEEAAQKEQEKFDAGEIVLIGTNKFENPEDKMSGDLELFPFLKIKPRKTLIKPIIEKRLAESLEKKRLEAEKTS